MPLADLPIPQKPIHRWRFLTQLAGLSLGLLTSWVPALAWAEVVNLTLLQLNDISEITPIAGGQQGGLGRVATLRQRLLAQNPQTLTILAGDTLSPSALGTAKVEGERLAGKPMVAVLNALGLDYATFGNHDFDLTPAEFLQSLQASKFHWLSSNVDDAQGGAFPGVLRDRVMTIPSSTGKPVRVGLIGLTLDRNPTNYVRYRDPIATAKAIVDQWRDRVDIVIAITHLSLAQDQQLAVAVPEIDLILGGHEHENIQQWRIVQRPQRFDRCVTPGIPIFKADANARTVYVHHLQYETTTHCLSIDSTLQAITSSLPDYPPVTAVIQAWIDRGFQAFRANGFEPNQVVARTTEPLDGLASSVRNYSTNLTRLIAQAMLQDVAEAELAIYNSGSIRVDDRLPAGPITQYDVLRILPFGGNVLAVELPGDLLWRVLEQGQANRGQGGYLQTANVTQTASGQWQIQGQPLQRDRRYKVAINDFLLSGREQHLEFLTAHAPGVRVLAQKQDIRLAVIRQLQSGQTEGVSKPGI